MGGKQIRAIEMKASELEDQLSSTKSMALSTKANLEATKKEIETLKNQMSATQRLQQGMEMKFEKQLASTKADVSSTNARLKAANTDVQELKEQISTRKNTERDMSTKLYQMMELGKEVYSTKIESLLTKIGLEVSRKDEEELIDRLSNCDKFHQDMELKLLKVIELEKQIPSAKLENSSRRSNLEASKNDEEMLKQQLVAHEMFHQDMELKLRNVLELEKQVSSSKTEALANKDNLTVYKEQEEDLKEQLSLYEKYHKDIGLKLLKVMQLEKQASCTKVDASSAKANFEASTDEEVVLKEQLLTLEKFQQEVEMKLHKLIELEKRLSCTKGEALNGETTLEATRNELNELKQKLLANVPVLKSSSTSC